VSDDRILHRIVPKTLLDEITKEPRVDNLELSSEYSTSVDVSIKEERKDSSQRTAKCTRTRKVGNVRSVRFESFVETEDLRSGSGRHGSANERVSKTVLGDLVLEFSPIPEIGRSYSPKVVLEVSSTSGTSTVLLVRRVPTIFSRVSFSVFLRHVAGRFDSGVVDSLEDLKVELTSFRRVEGKTESHESIGETLNSNSDRSVTHVAVLCLLDWVVVDVDDSVQVESDGLDDVVKLLEIVNTVLDEGRKCDRSQVANGAGHSIKKVSTRYEERVKVYAVDVPLIGSRVLDNLGTQVGRFDGSEILLVRFLYNDM